MRKIFSILVVLMMVAGTFVSCSMPTNDTPTVSTVDIGVKDIKDIPNCDLSYLVFTDGKKAICTDKFAELIKSVSDKQSVLSEQHKKNIRDSEPDGWDDNIYYVDDSDGGWIWDADWNPNANPPCICINRSYEKCINTGLGIDIYLPSSHIR